MGSVSGAHCAFLIRVTCGVKARSSSTNPAPRSQPFRFAARSRSGSGMCDGAAQPMPLRAQHPHSSRVRRKAEVKTSAGGANRRGIYSTSTAPTNAKVRWMLSSRVRCPCDNRCIRRAARASAARTHASGHRAKKTLCVRALSACRTPLPAAIRPVQSLPRRYPRHAP